MYNLVVFVSGNGTTLQCIIDSINDGVLNAKINLVVSDNSNAYGLIRAKESNINTYVIENNNSSDIDLELESVLSNYKIDLIVLAGYLKLIGNRLISKYTIINTHPSLLPKFGGKGMYGMKVHQAVVDAKEDFSGPTIHYVNEKYDDGNIIAQTNVKVENTDTAETLSKKVQAAEKIQLVKVLKEFCK